MPKVKIGNPGREYDQDQIPSLFRNACKHICENQTSNRSLFAETPEDIQFLQDIASMTDLKELQSALFRKLNTNQLRGILVQYKTDFAKRLAKNTSEAAFKAHETTLKQVSENMELDEAVFTKLIHDLFTPEFIAALQAAPEQKETQADAAEFAFKEGKPPKIDNLDDDDQDDEVKTVVIDRRLQKIAAMHSSADLYARKRTNDGKPLAPNQMYDKVSEKIKGNLQSKENDQDRNKKRDPEDVRYSEDQQKINTQDIVRHYRDSEIEVTNGAQGSLFAIVVPDVSGGKETVCQAPSEDRLRVSAKAVRTEQSEDTDTKLQKAFSASCDALKIMGNQLESKGYDTRFVYISGVNKQGNSVEIPGSTTFAKTLVDAAITALCAGFVPIFDPNQNGKLKSIKKLADSGDAKAKAYLEVHRCIQKLDGDGDTPENFKAVREKFIELFLQGEYQEKARQAKGKPSDAAEQQPLGGTTPPDHTPLPKGKAKHDASVTMTTSIPAQPILPQHRQARADAGEDFSKGAVKGALEEGAKQEIKLDKYFKMQKSGLPAGAIANALVREGIVEDLHNGNYKIPGGYSTTNIEVICSADKLLENLKQEATKPATVRRKG